MKKCKFKKCAGYGDKKSVPIEWRKDCPQWENTDDFCNIIPKPSKVKRIRAWMFHPVNITNGSTTGKVTDVTTQDMTGFSDWKSCTILIDAKYLAKDKGGRK